MAEKHSGSARNPIGYLKEYSFKEITAFLQEFLLIWSSGLFDATYYKIWYSDFRRGAGGPLIHFIRHGWRQGRNPSPFFDTQFYLEQYEDVRLAGINPLLHYILHGRFQGRSTSPNPGLRAIAVKSRVTRRGLAERFAGFRSRIMQAPRAATGVRAPRRITFFTRDEGSFLAMEPVAHEAALRGYDTVFTPDRAQHAEIGFYCEHEPDPTNADFAVVMLHDLGQEMWPENPSFEPNLWSTSPWNGFDIGILPGPAWSQCWYSVSEQPTARPRLGVYELGYPKADRVFADREAFGRDVQLLRKELGIKEGACVLYCPSWEYDDHQGDLVRALIGMPVNILIKHPTWGVEAGSRDRLRSIADGSEGHRQAQIYYMDPKLNIMHCLALADAVVSDESNCLVEALLFEVPGISVTDWRTPKPGSDGANRFPIPPPCAIRTDRAGLGAAVEHALHDRPALLAGLRQHRDNYFNWLGESSKMVMDVVDAGLSGARSPIEPLPPKPILDSTRAH
jgi:hypothetical protein